MTSAVQAQWKPTKPINIIVPWAAGGATDQMIRITAGDLEAALGQKIVVLNQPGASGSIGTKNALEAPKDGYTWTSGAPKDLGSYKILGMVDTTVQDWNLYLHLALPTIVSVPVSSPYKDMKALLEAMKAKPGQVSVATAGVNSSGHTAIEQIVAATGVKYKHVTYDGGNPAVIATVAGETEVTTQLSSEQAEMIRGKRLRPLAVVGDKAIEIEGPRLDPAAVGLRAWLQDPGQLLRHLRAQGCARRGHRDARQDLDGPDRQVGSHQEIRDQPRRDDGGGRWRRGAEDRHARRGRRGLAEVHCRPGQDIARHHRHPQALTASGRR